MSAACDWLDITSAPRDGTVVRVRDFEGNGPFLMRWNPAGVNSMTSVQPGIWEDIAGYFTWCEDSGFGPTHWAPVAVEAR